MSALGNLPRYSCGVNTKQIVSLSGEGLVNILDGQVIVGGFFDRSTAERIVDLLNEEQELRDKAWKYEDLSR